MDRFYARDCVVKTIETEESQKFVNENHRQGAIRSNRKIISLGLFHKSSDVLLGVAQFCSPRTSRKKREYSTELLRLAFKGDIRIVGGASKLIKNYIRMYSPSDIFTYQDTTGENTDVYLKSGFDFIASENAKEYLVAPGKTFDTANRSANEIYSIAMAAKLGPDILLKTNLGEVFKDDGKRKTNIELFEDLGWTRHKTSGDDVYAWFNPDISFYTYKITATDSDKYYFGVRKIKIPNATVDDCLNDAYMGSGGRGGKNNKFVNWKKKHSSNLKKEIIKIFSTKNEAYSHERDLIKDLWRTDPNCLNSRAGGVVASFEKSAQKHEIKSCPIHGAVSFQGESCTLCTSQKSLNFQNCEIHGNTQHRKNRCMKCAVEESISVKTCDVHGEVKHRGNSCIKCLNSSIVKSCEIHGETKHLGDSCYKCLNEKNIALKNCFIHGLTKHIGETCYKCRNSGYTQQICDVHGLTAFKKDKCCKCSYKKPTKTKQCILCNESFTPTNYRQKICSNEHYVNCEYCGKPMKYNRKTNYCSASCGLKAKNQKDKSLKN